MHDKLSFDKARAMIEALENVGENDLAETLKSHFEARARGDDPKKLAELWLRG